MSSRLTPESILATVWIPERDTRWMEEAECRDKDPELFYPEDWKIEVDQDGLTRRGGLPTMRQKLLAEVREICACCPVIAECLADANALEKGNPYIMFGVRAGLTAAERKQIARQGGLFRLRPA